MISFSKKATGFRKAQNTLNRLVGADLTDGLSSLAHSVSNDMAQMFATAYYSGFNDVLVQPYVLHDGSISVVARGKAVTFIEFGAGTYYPGAEYAARYGYIRGTYGHGKGANPPWSYQGAGGGDAVTVGDHHGDNYFWITYGSPALRAFEFGTSEFRSRVVPALQKYYSSHL